MVDLNYEFALIAVSLIASAFFSSSETALTSLSPLKVAQIIENGGKEAKYFSIWMNHPNKMLNTILIGNNVVNIFASVLAGDIAMKISGSAQLAMTTAIMTILILFFGEITPKTFAKHNAESFARFSIRILVFFYYLFYPFTYIINLFAKGIIKLAGGEIDKEKPLITEDELEFMISVSQQEGILEDKTKEMMHNIIDIKNVSVKEIMVPRTEMVCIEINKSISDLLDLIEEHEYSRIPAYEGRLDNIIGIIYIKDLIKKLKEKSIEYISLREILREAMFVPETKHIYDLFKEFQAKRVHVAIVIDEYGGVAGLVTMEDILEEIVGEIRDEYDEKEEDEFIKVSDDRFIVDAGMDLDDFCEKLGIEKTEEMEEYETVAGLVYDLADRIPAEGDEFELEGKYRIKVLKVSGKKIEKIEVRKIEQN
ncbi:hemolysin family protein [Hippea alviniae]|uniref:hemolysin family protein n=1 Tax=Hippea alviniae TaxID=1279027 RepID=UPI0003B74336|nr:hemolysin family protein [Hippea alviniae]